MHCHNFFFHFTISIKFSLPPRLNKRDLIHNLAKDKKEERKSTKLSSISKEKEMELNKHPRSDTMKVVKNVVRWRYKFS